MDRKQSGRVIPTLGIIAEKAGVSRETVSHILGGKHAARYRKETRNRVTAIAQKLRYRPHRGAQIMKNGRSSLIAIVHFGGGLEAADRANQALSVKVGETGFDYLAIDMNWYGGSVDRILEELISARVEGVLISHIQEVFKTSHIEELINSGIPIVAVNGEHRPNMTLVCDDVNEAYYELTRHLIGNGHRVILNLTHPVPDGDVVVNRSVSQRGMGFRRAIEQSGVWRDTSEEEFFKNWPSTRSVSKNSAVKGITVEQDQVLYQSLDRPVYRFCQRLFQQKSLPDAIVCRNDSFAMEVIASALEHGLSIPNDIALVGYDNDRIGALPAFGITTAKQDFEGICSKAVKSLIRQIGKEPVEEEPSLFQSQIIVRTSSGPKTPKRQ